ncbi:MAG TPA: DNA-primase RepB domain-containing protein, partial [Candidatus Competibacteraceae bacterium]|nr:DNA-primase RepB domain-containing protein [Candidatus Competibacteraceae bacterium]
PDTYKVIKPNQGFDLEAAHRAIARIEQTQGWQREQAGRYRVLENGEVARAYARERKRQPAQRQRDMEHRTGEKSAERIAIEHAAPVIRQARDWPHLHQNLAAIGMRYERKGSGAVLWVGKTAIKASQADRQASLFHLEKRLGAYQPAPSSPAVERTPARQPEPLKANVPGWKEYIARRQAHYAEKEPAALALRTQHEQERQALYARQKAQREDLLAGRWKGQGDLLNALRSTTAAQQAAEKAALKERQQQAWQAHRQRFQRFPDLEEWLRQRRPEQAVQWRYRESEPGRIMGSDTPARPHDIRAFTAEIHGREVHYARQEAGAGRGVSFVDKGKQIDVYEWNDRESTLAALQLAAQKWGRFTVEGRGEYKALCVQLAAEHDFKITNPELQESIQRERQRRQQERQELQQARATMNRYPTDSVGPPRVIASQEPDRMPPDVKTPARTLRQPPQEPTPQEGIPPRLPSEGAHAWTLKDEQRRPPVPGQDPSPEHRPGMLEKAQPIPPGPLPQFEQYHAAVNADRYRVTVIKRYSDGGKQTFILDNHDGVTRGFTPEALVQHTPEMQRLPQRGENLYYTPLSEGKHHILIDDMDRGKLERFIQDGYQPAVILESSPGNYQAIITIPKLGTPHDRDVG